MAWQPNDTFLDVVNGEIRGVTLVKEALKKYGRTPSGIYTSKDKDIDNARKDLEHKNAAPGFQQWQLPVVLGPNQDVLAFTTTAAPGKAVPQHAHTVDLFRMIVSGSAIYNGTVLTAGDWMVVPAGEKYTLQAANNPGYISLHLYW